MRFIIKSELLFELVFSLLLILLSIRKPIVVTENQLFLHIATCGCVGDSGAGDVRDIFCNIFIFLRHVVDHIACFEL